MCVRVWVGSAGVRVYVCVVVDGDRQCVGVGSVGVCVCVVDGDEVYVRKSGGGVSMEGEWGCVWVGSVGCVCDGAGCVCV